MLSDMTRPSFIHSVGATAPIPAAQSPTRLPPNRVPSLPSNHTKAIPEATVTSRCQRT